MPSFGFFPLFLHIFANSTKSVEAILTVSRFSGLLRLWEGGWWSLSGSGSGARDGISRPYARHPPSSKASLTPRQRTHSERNYIHPNIYWRVQVQALELYLTFRCSLIRRAGVAIKCSDFLAPARIDCHCQTRGKSLNNCYQARSQLQVKSNK